MTGRTASEVGREVRRRREQLGLTQDQCGISSSLVKQIEAGTAPLEGRGSKRSALWQALRWPPDAMEQLAAGADPSTLSADEMPESQEALLAAVIDLTEAVRELRADLRAGRR